MIFLACPDLHFGLTKGSARGGEHEREHWTGEGGACKGGGGRDVAQGEGPPGSKL